MLDDIKKHNNSYNSWTALIIKQIYLIKAELLTLRMEWKWSLIIVLISPLSILFLLYLLTNNDNEYMIYIITGNVVMTLVTGTMLTLGQELGILKEVRGFDYYAVLSLRKINIIFAYLLRATILTIPSICILIIVGKCILNIPIIVHYSLFIIIVLSGLSLAGVGAAIGIYSSSANHASIVTQVVQPIIVYCAPVFLPLNSMPKFIQIASAFIPTTYIANAIRCSFHGCLDTKNIICICFFCIVSVFLVEKKIDWRQK